MTVLHASRVTVQCALLCLVACASAPVEQRDAATSNGKIDSSVINPPGDANNCSTQPCSILPQCGCSDMRSCDIADTSGTTACRTFTTGATEATACATSGDCALGYTCTGKDGKDKASGTCKKYCTTNSECGTPRGRCAIDVAPSTAIPLVCSSNCDPTSIVSAPCPDTFKCNLFTVTTDGTQRQITSCTPAGTLGQDADCRVAQNQGNDALCAKGYRCSTTSADVYKCRRLCKKSAPSCPGGTTCISFGTPYIIDTEYGICN